MAVLEKLRVKFGMAVSIIIALGLLSFIIDPNEVISAFQGMSSKYDVGEINGKSVSYNNFQEDVQKFTTINEIMTGSSAHSAEQQVQIRNATWQSLMYENLLSVGVGNMAVSGGAWSDYDGVPKTAYEQAQALVSSGASPDVILCTLGTNDAGNNRPLGEFVNSTDISSFDLTTFSGGFQATINYLQNHFPDAIIYVGWTPMGGLAFDTSAYIDKMKELCLRYGVEYIETRTCGITNISEIYADCFENGTSGGHPTAKGQQKIARYMARLFS